MSQISDNLEEDTFEKINEYKYGGSIVNDFQMKHHKAAKGNKLRIVQDSTGPIKYVKFYSKGK